MRHTLTGDLAWCRGFSFVEFVTKQEAKNAAESIAVAHLYGRRLLAEWAEQGNEGLDEIRALTLVEKLLMTLLKVLPKGIRLVFKSLSCSENESV